MPTVIVQPKYPNDPLPDVIADFNSALAEALPNCEIVTQVEQPYGHQVTLMEIIYVWLPDASEALRNVAELLVVVGVLCKWLRNHHSRDGGVRPRLVALYGPDGRVIKSVSIEHGVDSLPEVKDGDPSDAIRLPPRKP